jgi:hypothetical protein
VLNSKRFWPHFQVAKDRSGKAAHRPVHVDEQGRLVLESARQRRHCASRDWWQGRESVHQPGVALGARARPLSGRASGLSAHSESGPVSVQGLQRGVRHACQVARADRAVELGRRSRRPPERAQQRPLGPRRHRWSQAALPEPAVRRRQPATACRRPRPRPRPPTSARRAASGRATSAPRRAPTRSASASASMSTA